MEEKQKQTEERNENAETVIEVTDLCKVYKLYNKPTDRLKESLGLSRKKQFKEHYALKHVDLTIKKGESVGIIGTNGSGKSTILKIITGVLSKTSGDVKVNGRISALLELGAGFNMEYTGIENIYLNGTMIGFTEAEIDVKSMNCRLNKKQVATISVGFDIHGKEELNRIIDKLRKIDGVTDITRTAG